MGVRTRIGDERGFTIIELLVVLVIIGLLVVIALNSLGGYSVDAQDADAKSNARNIISVVEACNVSQGDYRDCESDDNPGIRDAGIALGGGRGQVVVTSDSKRSFLIRSLSRSGNVFRLEVTEGEAPVRTCSVVTEDRGGCSAKPSGDW